MIVRAFVLCAALATPVALHGQNADVPPVAETGLRAFVEAGADSAIAVWMRGTSFDSPATRATLAQGFARLAEQAGRMVGYDIVRVHAIGTHVRHLYVVLHYERAPAFLYLELYRHPEGWRPLTVEFNGAAEEVFPRPLLEP